MSYQTPNKTREIKAVVRGEILPGDFLHTLGNNYLSLTIAKIERLALTLKLSIFKNEGTSGPTQRF